MTNDPHQDAIERAAEYGDLEESALLKVYRYKEALRAIKARIDGQFDHPALMRFGALRIKLETDILEIIRDTLIK